jgi:hypothetical protein
MITVVGVRCMLDESPEEEGATMIDVVSVRGTLNAPLGEDGMAMYYDGSKVLVVRRMIEVVGDGSLWGEAYLARTTYADSLVVN